MVAPALKRERIAIDETALAQAAGWACWNDSSHQRHFLGLWADLASNPSPKFP